MLFSRHKETEGARSGPAVSAETPVLACRGLAFAWQKEYLFHDLQLLLPRGDYACLTGANGSGKTTLLKLILGELPSQEGEVLLFGTPALQFKNWNRLAYLPQNAITQNASFPATALELVSALLHGRRRRAGWTRRETRQKALQALDHMGLRKQAENRISELSGGQQQRVLLAATLASEPELMLLDEPCSGIDYENTLLIYRLLAEMRQELQMTILLITHDREKVIPYCDHFYCLEDASLVELSRAQVEDEMQHKHKHPHDVPQLDPEFLPETGPLAAAEWQREQADASLRSERPGPAEEVRRHGHA